MTTTPSSHRVGDIYVGSINKEKTDRFTKTDIFVLHSSTVTELFLGNLVVHCTLVVEAHSLHCNCTSGLVENERC